MKKDTIIRSINLQQLLLGLSQSEYSSVSEIRNILPQLSYSACYNQLASLEREGLLERSTKPKLDMPYQLGDERVMFRLSKEGRAFRAKIIRKNLFNLSDYVEGIVERATGKKISLNQWIK